MARYRLVAEGKLLNQQVVTVLHYVSAGVSPGAQDLAQNFASEIQEEWAAAASNGLEMESITVTDIDTDEQYVEPWVFEGDRIGDISGPQLAPLIAWKTSQAGRSKRGRTYFPGVNEGDVAFGLLTGTIKALLDTLATDLHTISGETATYNLNVYSRKLDLMQTVTSHIVRDIVYTQRRRTIGVGS